MSRFKALMLSHGAVVAMWSKTSLGEPFIEIPDFKVVAVGDEGETPWPEGVEYQTIPPARGKEIKETLGNHSCRITFAAGAINADEPAEVVLVARLGELSAAVAFRIESSRHGEKPSQERPLLIHSREGTLYRLQDWRRKQVDLRELGPEFQQFLKSKPQCGVVLDGSHIGFRGYVFNPREMGEPR